MTNFALSAYPLSRGFQTSIEQSLGKNLQYMVLGDLRKLSVPNMLGHLRKLKADHIYIVFETKNGQALLPIMGLIAAIAQTRAIKIIYPNLNQQTFSRLAALWCFQGCLTSSLINAFYYLRTLFKLKSLHKNKPIPPQSSNNQSILYIDANLWFGIKAGGSVGHIAGVINALDQRSYSVNYAAVESKALLSNKVQHWQLAPPTHLGLPSELNYYRFNEVIIRDLLKRSKHQPLKFIYQRMSIANYTGVTLSRTLNVPLILEYNGSEAWISKNWGSPLRFHNTAVQAEEVCLKHAHLIMTISEVLKDELLQRGVPEEKICFYPNCIDPQLFNPHHFDKQQLNAIRAEYGIQPNDIVLTFVGTFGLWHGVDVLAKTIKQLVDESAEWLRAKRIHFLLVGDGAKAAEVKQILADEKYRTFYTLTGLIPQQETPAYLALSDILLSPHVPNADGSRFFGSPTKLFEYMAMGKPVIASDLEQIGEVLRNSLTAAQLPTSLPNSQTSDLSILCKPGSINELISAIKFLVENKEWCKLLGDNARQEALKKYTWANHVDVFLERLDKL